MIPDKLTIEGLYSYQERQTIDFSTLIQAGLFGVFGAVGSGKSSILEAITFALFGKTERLNEKGDNRNYNMMNLKSNRTYIEFDFYNFEDRHFRITREYKRHKTKFRDVKVEAPVLYERLNGQWVPLEHTNVEQLIGLSYTNFKRTIIIPQGQFKEFLELGNKDRTQMMKEIFNLHRFDLQDKVARLNSENRSQLDQLNGQLLSYEEVSLELIQTQEQLLRTEQERLKNKEDAYKLAHDKFQLLKNLKSDFEELSRKKIAFNEVAAQQTEIEELQKKLQHYERTHQIFYQLLIDRKKLMKELDGRKIELREQQDLFNQLTQQKEKLKQQFDQLKDQYEKIETRKNEANDFALLIKIKTLASATVQKQQEIKDANDHIQKFDSKLRQLKESLETTLLEIEALRNKKLDSHVLIEVANWFAQHNRLQETKAQNHSTLREIDVEIQQINEKLEYIETDPDGKIQDKENEIKHLQQKRSHLDVQQKLAEYAHALHDGEPCPLCGAIEHPNAPEHADLSQEIALINTQITNCEQAIKGIQEERSAAQKLLERKKLFDEQSTKITVDIERIDMQITKHRTLFIWNTFDPSDQAAFETKRKNSLQLEKDLDEKERHVAVLRKQFENERKNLEQFNAGLTQLKLDEAQALAQIQNNKSHLRVLNDIEFEQYSAAELQRQHQELLQSIQNVELAFAKVTEDVNTNRAKLAAQESSVSSTSKHISSLETQLETVQREVDEALVLHRFNDIEDVRMVLAQRIDINATRHILENFRIKLETLRSAVSTLESKLEEVQFDEEEFVALGHQVTEMGQQVKTNTETVAQIDANLKRVSKQYEDKRELLLQQEKLQKRSDNLKVMTRLFKGQGFVEYVSSIFLRQLCDHANIRFRRMTRNQLSLSLNQENDFEIIDYLNDGKSRNVKTLSGGQAFQVSLSLALALAESVQSHARADRNFFFIDEGFGTQDNESVNMVFETLLSLQKENRIVGIISHVEELKERIPGAVHIHKDEARGSLIGVG